MVIDNAIQRLLFYALFSFVVPGVQSEMVKRKLGVWIGRTEELDKLLVRAIERHGRASVALGDLFNLEGWHSLDVRSETEILESIYDYSKTMACYLDQYSCIAIIFDPDITLFCGDKNRLSEHFGLAPAEYLARWSKESPGFWTLDRAILAANLANGLPL